MAKTYWVTFGSSSPNPQNFAGLTPTLILFVSQGGTNLTAPTPFTEVGVSTGFYTFTYDPSPTFAVAFIADGGAVLTNTDRYVGGVLDPISAVDTRVGFIQDSFGSTVADPTTLMGFAKRFQEFFEGDMTFTKATAIWQIFNRGSSTLLRQKNLSNNTTQATKTGL